MLVITKWEDCLMHLYPICHDFCHLKIRFFLIHLKKHHCHGIERAWGGDWETSYGVQWEDS